MPHFFISYRRLDQEGRYLAHMVFRELRNRYGEHSVFLDVDSLSPGLSFPVKVGRALDRTDVVLVIIGPAWLRLLNERSADSTDWVRYEVAQGLARPSLPVVPVCCPGVQVPRIDELPDDLKDLGWRDGITLDPFQDFDSHLHRFLVNVERVLEELREEKESLHSLRAQLAMLIARRRERALAPLLATLATRVARLQPAAVPPRVPTAAPVRAPVTASRNAPAAQRSTAGAPMRQPVQRTDRASHPHTDTPVSAELVANIRKCADEIRQHNRTAQVYCWLTAPVFGLFVGADTHWVAGVMSAGGLLFMGYVALWLVGRADARRLRGMVRAQDLDPAQRVDLARRLKDVKSPVLKRILSEFET